MASIYQLKPAFQKLWRPTVDRLASAGVTPNQVTTGTFVASLGLGGALALFGEQRLLWLGLPAWMFARMALNAIDGMLAREHQLQSPLGGLLNELTDPLADAALLLPFALLPGVSAPLVVGIVVLAVATELVGVVATQIGASRRYDGPMGKSDRAFLFAVFALLHGLGLDFGLWSDIGLGLALLLTALTVLNRGRKALDELEEAA